MAINKGYLTSDRTSAGDEVLTPFYAVEPLLEFIPANSKIWCPCDTENSAFVQLFKESGHTVIFSHIEDGKDFLTYEPDEPYDYIITNPPFSIKDKILQRCYDLNKPFALLLPVPTLQGKARVEMFIEHGLQLLVLDGRVNYHTNGNTREVAKGNHFGSMFFCKDFLTKDLIFRRLNPYERPLVNSVTTP